MIVLTPNSLMIVRIVTMQFQSDKIATFKTLFDERKEKIRQFPGCYYLELLQGENDKHIFKTYSHWESEDHLNAYRHSELFAETWKLTKAMFAAKPKAISLQRLHKLK